MIDLMASSDGDIPLFMRIGSGNESDLLKLSKKISKEEKEIEKRVKKLTKKIWQKKEELEKEIKNSHSKR